VTIAVTDACPLNCWHCSVPKSAAGKTPLGTGEIKRVIAECLELGVTNITFTGGEPLLRGDLEELIASVPSDKAVSLVFTNAAELTPERAASIRKAGAVGIQISLDSPDPGEHDSRRGRPGLFDLVKSGTENALRAGLLVGLSTYASNESIAQRKLTRITQLAAEWGAHEISVFDLIPTGRLLHAADALITPDHRRWLLREAKDLNKRFRGKPRVITQSWTNCGKGFARFIGCLAGHYQFHISAGGEFMPCDFTPLSFGNVRVFSISALWAKVLKHPAYSGRSHACRIQDLEFRKKYIDPLPPDADLPAPIEPHG
jgi:MoaA/NifB/PqqE/SkfB family radical SAM enzyme